METTSGRISQRKNQPAGSTLPEIGKIKVGMKVENSSGTSYPKSIDYFRATGNFAAEFQKIYGAKPNKISVAFVSNDLSEVCNERYECWEKGKRWGYGDGTTFTIWNNKDGVYVHDIPADSPIVKGLKWDIMLTLRFVLLDMKGILGHWSFTTKGKASTIPSVVKAFDFVRERAGTIAGFPFTLMVEMKTGYNPGDAKKYPVVTLVPNFSETAIEQVNSYLEQGGNMNKITTNFVKAKETLELSAGNTTLQIEAPKISVDVQPDLFANDGGTMA